VCGGGGGAGGWMFVQRGGFVWRVVDMQCNMYIHTIMYVFGRCGRGVERV
jgi:hypothetical protein